MDPNYSGWLRQFCESVRSSQLEAEKPLLPGYEPTLYKTIQPSGLMYGHPVKEIGEMQFCTDKLDPVSRMKMVYIESLMVTGRLRLDENVSIQDQSGVVGPTGTGNIRIFAQSLSRLVSGEYQLLIGPLQVDRNLNSKTG